MQVKMSKSSQNTPSIDNIGVDVIEKARISEEDYWKLREELRKKYGNEKK